MDKEKQIEINCNNCKRQHTRYCPNSSECMSLPNLPYFETDVIRLLEHDWSMHEKKIYELEAENESIRQNSVSHETFKLLMDEKDKEIAVLNRALENMASIADCDDCAIIELCDKAELDCYCSCKEVFIMQAKKELDEYEEKLEVVK